MDIVDEVLDSQMFCTELAIGGDGFIITYVDKDDMPQDGDSFGVIGTTVFVGLEGPDADLRKSAFADIQSKLQWLVSNGYEHKDD